MSLHQVAAICIVIALAFVVDSTVKLYRFRRKNKITDRFRDIRILRRPTDFPFEETRLTYRSWISCAATLGFIVLFLILAPEGVGPMDALSPGPAETAG